jgi:ankyrin repeat protein
MLAARYDSDDDTDKQVSVLKQLLSRASSVDVNKQDVNGNTALHCVLLSCQVEDKCVMLVNVFVEKPMIDLQIKNVHGHTVGYIAHVMYFDNVTRVLDKYDNK